MRIYTKTGDTGSTGLVGGDRVQKDDLRIDAIGHVDELNAALGVARAFAHESRLDSQLERIQHELFDFGAELATPTDSRFANESMTAADVERLETSIDEMVEVLPPLKNFVLPGGTHLAAHLHKARTICRRAERTIVTLQRQDTLRPELLFYLNRLSDWLFTAARMANFEQGAPDVLWQKRTT